MKETPSPVWHQHRTWLAEPPHHTPVAGPTQAFIDTATRLSLRISDSEDAAWRSGLQYGQLLRLIFLQLETASTGAQSTGQSIKFQIYRMKILQRKIEHLRCFVTHRLLWLVWYAQPFQRSCADSKVFDRFIQGERKNTTVDLLRSKSRY